MQFDQLTRRQLVALLGGAAAASPLAARAQQPDRMRRIGVLMNLATDDPEAQTRVTAFLEGLRQLGWTDGRNVLIDYRWGAIDLPRARKLAAELLALSPDVVMATAAQTVAELQQATRSVPIVFVNVVDPVGAGFVASLARPGGNTTGFTLFEFGIAGKWLEMLKQIAPRLTRAAVLRDPSITSGIGQFAAIQAVAPSFGVELTPYDVRDVGEIERAVASVADAARGGVIVTVSSSAADHRDLIVAIVARHRVPAIYSARYFVGAGGMISYGPNYLEGYARAAGYVVRILKGEKPADLPVQAPTRYELAVNAKTAKALGLDIPDHPRPSEHRGPRCGPPSSRVPSVSARMDRGGHALADRSRPQPSGRQSAGPARFAARAPRAATPQRLPAMR
jgi:putative ABC transport system substrate-binding protein